MSNRPNPPHATTHGSPGDRKRVLLIGGGLVLLVVIVGLIVALAGGTESSDNEDDTRPVFGAVEISGEALPVLDSPANDTAIGLPAPSVSGKSPDGDAVSVGGAGTGEPTVITFLAHWCPHCQVELPLLVDLMDKGELEGVRMVAVLTATDPARPNFPPAPWVDEEGWTGDTLLDNDEFAAAQAYGVGGYPFLVVLDGDGNVVARTSGEVPADQILALVDSAR
jgi:thiol-disulfide isomerase/thioredoxin